MLAPKLSETISTILGLSEKRGDVGIELETEGDYLPVEITNWVVKHEGSLRGKNGRVVSQDDSGSDIPREYVSRGPIPIDLVRTRVEALQEAFKQNKSVIRLTDRASTHMHLNMTRETASTFAALLVLYAAIEPVLLRLCGERRNGNLFCVPSYETWDLPQYADAVSLSLSQENSRYGWPERGKYGAINPDPITHLGSVEFRCFPNTFDPVRLQTYANWLVNLRTLASAMEPPFDRELGRIGRDPDSLLSAVFGREELRTACAPHNTHNLVHFGLEQSHEIREGFESVFVWTPLQKRGMRKGLILNTGVLRTGDITPGWVPAPSTFAGAEDMD